MSIQIFFNNLDKETQEQVLDLYNVKEPEDMNWDVFPLFVLEDPEV